MGAFAIMIIWIGVTNTQTMAMQRFDSMAECEAAKAAIVRHYEDTTWSVIPSKHIACIEVRP